MMIGIPIADRAEMLVESFLGRLVVIGRDDQRRIRARLLGVSRQFHRFARTVRAGPRDDGHAPARLVGADGDQAAVFVGAQRRAFAGRAGRHEPVRARGDLPVDQRPEGQLVDFSVLKGGYQGRHRTVKLRPLVHFALPGHSARVSPGASPKRHIAPRHRARKREASIVVWLTIGQHKRRTIAARPTV
jgi:hypothetical protein